MHISSFENWNCVISRSATITCRAVFKSTLQVYYVKPTPRQSRKFRSWLLISNLLDFIPNLKQDNIINRTNDLHYKHSSKATFSFTKNLLLSSLIVGRLGSYAQSLRSKIPSFYFLGLKVWGQHSFVHLKQNIFIVLFGVFWEWCVLFVLFIVLFVSGFFLWLM